MSTKTLRMVLERVCENPAAAIDPIVMDAWAAVEAIEKAALDLVAWNDNGQSGIDVAAARGFGVLERIAAEAKARQG